MPEIATLYSDGGSRGNPGPAGIGFELQLVDGSLIGGGAYIGEASNNVAEYQAIIWGLQNALEAGVEKIILRADSQLAVKQILGEYKVKNEGIKPLFAEVVRLLKCFKGVRVEHVYREDNKQADSYVNEALDAKESVGNYLLDADSAIVKGLLDLVDESKN